MKWTISLLLTCTVLTACGQSNHQATTPEATATSKPSVTASAEVNQNTTKANQTSTEQSEESTEDTQYYGDYQMDPEDTFNTLIHNNPLDQAYHKEYNKFQNSSQFSTTGWVTLEVKYLKLWNVELNNTMQQLKSKLSASQYALLQQSQAGWAKYDKAESEFVEDTFLKNAHFGSQGQVSAVSTQLSRTRERTIQLMEYVYELNDHQLQFVYQ